MTDIQVVEVQIPGLQGPQGEPSPDMEEILAAQAAAEAAAAAAAASAEEAEDWASTSAAASEIYPDTTAGLAATADGGYFYVPSGDADESLILYRDVAGVATEIKRTPSASAVTDVLSIVPDIAPLGYAGGVGDAWGNYNIAWKIDGTTLFHTIEVSSMATMAAYGTLNVVTSDDGPIGYGWCIADNLSNVSVAVKNDGTLAVRAIDQLDSINGIAIAEYLGGGSSGGGSTYPDPILTADINHIVGYGQSRGTGYDSLPIQTSSQAFDALRFVGGVRPADGGAAPGIYASLVPLIETLGGAPHGETLIGGMMECIKERVTIENLITSGTYSYQMLGSVHAADGTNIDGLDNGTTPFNNVKAGIDAGYARAQALGKSYKFRGFTWSQGESDYVDSTLPATYETKLLSIRSDLDTYAKSVTHQTEDVICFIDQLDDHENWGHVNDAYLAVLMNKMCKENANFVMVCPIYTLATSSGSHLVGSATRTMGAYHGIAYKRTIIDGVKWEPLWPISVLRQGTILNVRFHVPMGNLTIDTVGMALQTNYGFSLVTSANVDIPITSVAITSSDTLRVVASTAPAAGAKLRYGFGANGGNLRDSQGDTIIFGGGGFNKPLHNWCVIFEEILA